ncbi:DUF3135 domain-containing protein [Geotalea toluenoxydans]|uniref:DUF3135 domain-containing protein n=1 Tax=Geotalea toluenoxydans TaxID=421624 RepID=UPI0006D1118E|nr:DUF3135 domain-containing protein [Geotalea toluenoxydans]
MDSESKLGFSSYTPTELVELYRKNPDLFDEMAAGAIRQACIGGTPEQTLKLRQMQWTIDAKLQKGKTPLERMHIMENIFYDQVYSDKGQLYKLIAGWAEVLGAINLRWPVSRKKSHMRLLKK